MKAAIMGNCLQFVIYSQSLAGGNKSWRQKTEGKCSSFILVWIDVLFESKFENIENAYQSGLKLYSAIIWTL